jgi:hypothetical protein
VRTNGFPPGSPSYPVRTPALPLASSPLNCQFRIDRGAGNARQLFQVDIQIQEEQAVEARAARLYSTSEQVIRVADPRAADANSGNVVESDQTA